MKKILALVCTLCLLLTALPLTALAADDDWVTLNVEMYPTCTLWATVSPATH